MTPLDVIKKEVQERLNGSEGKRFAVFDFDNTCIDGDIGEALFRRLCDEKRLRDFTLIAEAPGDYHERVSARYWDLVGKGDIHTAYPLCTQALSGFTAQEIDTLVDKELASGTISLRTDIQECMNFLRSEGVGIWMVTASPRAAVARALQHFGIEASLIGMRNIEERGVFTKDIEKPYSIAEGKVSCIQMHIDPVLRPIFAAGDSTNDLAMLEYSLVPLVVNRHNELTAIAQARGWHLL